MIIEVKEFHERIKTDLSNLVTDLQAVTGRCSKEESSAWRNSLPRLAKIFSSPGFDPLHLHFNGAGALSLEYQLPASSSWCDVVLLGKKNETPGAVIIELKHWLTSTDAPGAMEGLIQHCGRSMLHPSDQVRGYAEYCRRFHSAVIERRAEVRGCVLFTRDTDTNAYREKPNHELTSSFPCFSLAEADVSEIFPSFIADIVDVPDLEFATAFETGRYKQDRGFVQQIGDQILHPNNSPFELLDNQRRAFAHCKAQVNASLFSETSTKKKKVIVIEGPPGSGKSAVAAKIWAALATDKRLPEGPIVFTTTSASQSSNWAHLFKQNTADIVGDGVVKTVLSYIPISPQAHGRLKKELNNPDLFGVQNHWKDNLRTLNGLKVPYRNGARDGEYLVSVVDEAHALVNPEHSEGRAGGYVPGLGPQAFHVMRVSHVSIFLLDTKQSFRTQENTTVDDLKRWASDQVADFTAVNLEGSQFRCAGSTEYVDWVEAVLAGENSEKCRALATAWNKTETPLSNNVISSPSNGLKIAEETTGYKVSRKPPSLRSKAQPLEFKIYDNPQALENGLREKVNSDYTARILAPFARPWITRGISSPQDLPSANKDFNIPYEEEGIQKTWSKVMNHIPNGGSDYASYIQGKEGARIHDDPLCEVGCPYTVRGFDWDYVGILWMSDLTHDKNQGWQVNPKESHEAGFRSLIKQARKESDPQGAHHINLLEAVSQAYRILLTRPIRGIYLWFENQSTRSQIECCIAQPTDM